MTSHQTVHTRPLGDSLLHVAPLVIGTMARRGDDRAARFAIYESALAQGFTSFDTAPLYGFGAAEEILGEALAGTRRDAVQILGKVGLRWDAGDHGEVLFEFRDEAGERRQVRRNSRPESVREEIERSLERLGTDYLDLVQIHQPDPHTPIDETADALLEARGRGLVREIGASNFTPAQMQAFARALAPARPASLQSHYSLLNRQVEQALLAHCRKHGIGLLAYSPLEAGHLARRPEPQAGTRTFRAAMEGTLLPIAQRHGVDPAAVAIAWLLDRAGVSGVISGVSSVAQLEAQVPGATLRLTAEADQDLTRTFLNVPSPAQPVPSVATRIGGRLRRGAGSALRRIGLDPALRRRGRRDTW